jgi:O-acetyl-ADP-ribose deacetylase (regulator of RNase III)
MRITLVPGDITRQPTGAIVNASDSSLLGVDGAIHRPGGPEIPAACQRLCAESYPDDLPTAVATTPMFHRCRADNTDVPSVLLRPR